MNYGIALKRTIFTLLESQKERKRERSRKLN